MAVDPRESLAYLEARAARERQAAEERRQAARAALAASAPAVFALSRKCSEPTSLAPRWTPELF